MSEKELDEMLMKVKGYLKDIRMSTHEIGNLVDVKSFENALLHAEWLKNHVSTLSVLLGDCVKCCGGDKKCL